MVSGKKYIKLHETFVRWCKRQTVEHQVSRDLCATFCVQYGDCFSVLLWYDFIAQLNNAGEDVIFFFSLSCSELSNWKVLPSDMFIMESDSLYHGKASFQIFVFDVRLWWWMGYRFRWVGKSRFNSWQRWISFGWGGRVVTESTLALVPSGWESSDQCMNLNAHLYVVLRLRVHGAIPQFLMSSWYGH